MTDSSRFSQLRNNTFRFLLVSWLLTFLPIAAWAGDEAVLARLKQLPGVTNVKEILSSVYDNKYVMSVEQEVDPIHHQGGTFKQRVIVCHVGFDRPTVLVTEGYDANYALDEDYQEELSRLLDANLIFVEYRYFAQSTPNPCNWKYLTVENSLYDLHHVNKLFHSLYSGKWIATGISKGGQTCMFYRAWFPDDVALSVPYVAPLNKDVEDRRPQKFIEDEVSTPDNRQIVKDFQLTALKRKAALMPSFEKLVNDKHLTFRVPLSEIYDYCVLEYSFAVWQWGHSMTDIPASNAPDSVIFKELVNISGPKYFAEESPFLPFNIQAARELGYYSYDVKPLRPYISLSSADGYMHRIMLPEEFKDMEFDPTLYKKTVDFLKHNDPEMIYIYGSLDPWSSTGVAQLKFLKRKNNIHVFTLPGGCHSTRIKSFPKDTRDQILKIFEKVLGEEVHWKEAI
ncbi:MAG: S28 family serine protease [Prevotella sp.]